MEKFMVNGEAVHKNGYYKVVVGSNTSPSTFEFPCRGYNLEFEIKFQNSLKHSSFFVEKISEKEHYTLVHG